MLWAAHGPIISRDAADAAAARHHVLATRRRTVGPAPDAIGATHRVAANGFKVRVKIRTPGPRRPSHAYRTPSPRGKRRRQRGGAPTDRDGVVLFFFYDKT